MTIGAYNKVSPSILGDYPTKEDLQATLSDYVKEAPIDGKVYARTNGNWASFDAENVQPVEEQQPVTQSDPFTRTISLWYGDSTKAILSNVEDINSLPVKDEGVVVYTASNQCTIGYIMKADGYFWIVSNTQIEQILFGSFPTTWVGNIIQSADGENGEVTTYYAYRTPDELIKDDKYSFILTLSKQ